MRILVKASKLLSDTTEGRTGFYRDANANLWLMLVTDFLKILEGMYNNRSRLVINEDMVPPEILKAMGLFSWGPEIFGILLTVLEPTAMETYIDASENYGIPPDTCSLPKATMGLALNGEIPDGSVIVSSNLPCDGGMTSYELIKEKLGLPIFRLDIPHRFKTERAEEYFTGELKRLIKWLEENTRGRMDWERLRNICEERNKMAELEHELWDMLRIKPTPMAGEPIYLSHLWKFNLFPGDKASSVYYQNLLDLCRKTVDEKKQAIEIEKYRVILWNPPLAHFREFFKWAEQTYGIALLIDSMTFNRQSFIDTKDNESMLRGVGKIIMDGPMARHTRGPCENYLDDIFFLHQQFKADMLWVANNIGCKSSNALNGMLREKCREKNIPLLIIDYDLMDPRVVTKEGIMDQVNHFMENIMNAEKLNVDQNG